MYFVWLLFHHPEPPRMSFRLLLLLPLPHCNKIYRRCDSKTNYKMCVIGSSLKYWQAIYGIDLKTYSIDLHLGASECRLNRRYSRKQQPNWLIAECREFRYTGFQTHHPPKPQQTIDLKNSTSVSICSLCGSEAAVCCSRRFWKLIINEENLWFEWRDRLRSYVWDWYVLPHYKRLVVFFRTLSIKTSENILLLHCFSPFDSTKIANISMHYYWRRKKRFIKLLLCTVYTLTTDFFLSAFLCPGCSLLSRFVVHLAKHVKAHTQHTQNSFVPFHVCIDFIFIISFHSLNQQTTAKKSPYRFRHDRSRLCLRETK